MEIFCCLTTNLQVTISTHLDGIKTTNHDVAWSKGILALLDLPQVCRRGINLPVLSLISNDGWWLTDAKVSSFWEAIWFRLSQAQIWMSQSRLHQRAPFGFINSQRRSSLSIIAMITMFWICLAQSWNILTEGITSEVCLLSSLKLNP